MRWLAAGLRGDRERQRQGEKDVRLILCSPTPQHRRIAIDFLIENDAKELARTAYDSLLALTVLESGEATTFTAVAQGFSALVHEDEPASAARWLDLGVIALIQSSRSPASYFGWYPMLVQGFRLEAAIQERDEELARTVLQRINRLDPLDIDHAESLLPKVREAGMKALADQTMKGLVEAGHERFRVTPFNVVLLNNLAWVLAVNDYDLPQALRWSRRAVAWEPDSAVYRDTLAEILFRMGRTREAIEVEESCLLDAPADHHLHKQLSRFRKQ